jgi:ribosomal protein S20
MRDVTALRACLSDALTLPQVFAAVAAAKAAGGEAAMATVEALLSEAYKTIDQAAGKGILKKNTAARRKALVANARNSVTAAA